jgi:hypothetical protein
LWEGWNLYTFNQNGRVFPKTRSATQAEQVFHPDVFTRHLLGLEITKPGAEEVQVSFKGYNKNMEGVIPTVKGDIFIRWTLEGRDKQLQVTCPKAIKIVINKSSIPKDVKVNVEKSNSALQASLSTSMK